MTRPGVSPRLWCPKGRETYLGLMLAQFEDNGGPRWVGQRTRWRPRRRSWCSAWLGDWTQEELAQEGRSSAGSISYYEREEIVPPREALGKIARPESDRGGHRHAPGGLDPRISLAREPLAAAQPVDLAARITS